MRSGFTRVSKVAIQSQQKCQFIMSPNLSLSMSAPGQQPGQLYHFPLITHFCRAHWPIIYWPLAYCSMLHSMTGFGRAEANLAGRQVIVEIKSLNGKGFEL